MRGGAGEHGGVARASEASATANVAAGVSTSPGTTRVYMGGLGAGVTEADVGKTFAPLGSVRRVELVRTKGRAFAFMEFEPNSDKSLANLFATYNGCIWKGGRLRLEKAKEHYLDRLRREWAEDAEPTSKPNIVDTSEDFSSSEKSKPTTEEMMQLRIFFPKLRKVKVLPFKGTGKHKYSFQRIAVPSIPVHFCDCEEHYQSSEDPNQDQLKDQSVVVNEEESNIMDSVMKKLLEKEANANVSDGMEFLSMETDILVQAKNEAQFGDSETAQDTDADADNLVTNIGLGDGEDVLDFMQLKGWVAASADQGLVLGKPQSFHDGSLSEKQIIPKRQVTGPGTALEAPSCKRARLASEKSMKSKLSSVADGKRDDQETESQERSVLPPTQSQQSSCPTDESDIRSKRAQNSDVGQSAKGTSWIQKSSWKELVGDTGSTTFTISHLLPGVKSLSATSSKPNGAANVGSDTGRTAKPVSDGGHLKLLEARERIPGKSSAAPRREGKASKQGGTDAVGEGNVDKATRNDSNEEPRAAAAKVGVGQVCTFMRSADSEKEWARTKAALSGYLKKNKPGNGNPENTKVPSLHR